MKDHVIKYTFSKIPGETGFSLFDLEDKKLSIDRQIPVGDSEFEVVIPGNWKNPYQVIAPHKYYVEDRRIPLDRSITKREITGEDYYLDIDPKPTPEEENKTSIENLITTIQRNEDLDERQKFFIALVSLQSHFEFLVHGMLVTSGYKSNSEFKSLNTHENRTLVAFDIQNNDFFNDQIVIEPKNRLLGSNMEQNRRAEIKGIFDEIRTLRNKVVHRWGYKDLGQKDIEARLLNINESVQYSPSVEGFYLNTVQNFVSLFCRANPIKMQLDIISAREKVKAERKARGY